MQTTVMLSIPLCDLADLVETAVAKALDNRAATQQSPAPIPARPESYLTRHETRAMLHVSFPTLRRMERARTLVPSRVGRRVLFARADVERVVSEGRT